MYMFTTPIIGIISRGNNEEHKNIINKHYREKIKKEQFESSTNFYWHLLLYDDS